MPTRAPHPQGTALRIACVQHGDYREALQQVAENAGEPYFGMRESVAALRSLFGNHPSLVMSLEAPSYDEKRSHQRLLGLPLPTWPAKSLRLRIELRAQRVLYELRRFRPTHVLLRADGILGLRVARWCRRNQIPTLVTLANAVWSDSVSMQRVNRQFMTTLNAPTFDRIYNYKPTACLSMHDCGLDANKSFPYEFAGERQPHDYAPKRHAQHADCHVVFAARMIEAKGPLDVVTAVTRLHGRGLSIRATMFGQGAMLDAVRARASRLPEGVIRTPGHVDNETLFATLRASSFACVPTHPTFVEGMPMALTEALASRTPVLASDCQVFARSFQDGEGVRLFRAGDAEKLAELIADTWSKPALYDALSVSTAAAFDRVSAHRAFRDVLAQWKREIDPEAGAADQVPGLPQPAR
jgi:glycosyltransferase involved in cell wall biosynthesis